MYQQNVFPLVGEIEDFKKENTNDHGYCFLHFIEKTLVLNFLLFSFSIISCV